MGGGQPKQDQVEVAKAPADYAKYAVYAPSKIGAAAAAGANPTILTGGAGDPSSATIGRKQQLT